MSLDKMIAVEDTPSLRKPILNVLSLLLGSFLLAMLAYALVSVPAVYYDSGTTKAVRCSCEETDWIEMPISTPACQKVLKGRHEAVWIAPGK